AVVEAVISAGALQLGRHLRRDHVHCLGLLETPRRDEPLEAKWTRSIDQHDGVELLDEVPLKQKRNHADHYLVAAIPRVGALAIAESGHARVNDSVEGIELVLIGKDDLTQGIAVEAAIVVQDVLAPALDDVLERLGLGTHSFAGKH